MTRKQKRLAIIGGLGAVLAIAATLIFIALRDQIVFFYSPSEVKEKAIAVGTPIPLGRPREDRRLTCTGGTFNFVVTDGASELSAHFKGLLLDLFREGQGVVVEARGGDSTAPLPPPTCSPSTTRITCRAKWWMS